MAAQGELSGWAWIGLLVGAVALTVLLLRKSVPQAQAEILAFGPAPSPRIRSFAQAIARAEGFFVSGSIPARAKNPGNLKLGGPNTINGITVYSTEGEGWAALYRQLNLIASGSSKYYRPEMTIREMGNVWAPPADRNVLNAWSSNVAGTLGVSTETRLSQVLV